MPATTEMTNRQSRLLGRIQGVLTTLSANDRRIAEYLLTSFPRSAWDTVETVARDVGVSKAAVIRFAARLGYEGFADLQRDLQNELAELFASPLSLLEAMAPTQTHETFERFRQSVLRNLTATPHQDTPVTAMDLAARMARCEGRIHVMGASKSYGAAHYAHYTLSLILPNVVLVPPEPAALPTALLDIGPQDIVLGICVRRYSTLTIAALKHCRERGAHVVTITDSPFSPPVQVSSTVIVAPSQSHSFHDSAVMVIFYIEAIVSAVAAERRDAATARLAESVRLGRQFGIFEDSKM